MKNKKFKIKAEERLKKLEADNRLFLKRDDFQIEMDKTEGRIFAFIREQMAKYSENLNSYKETLDDCVVKFDKQITDYRSQVLWRIKDCEELLRNRVSTQELNDSVKSLE